MNNPLIILGGMGPQASLELHRLLIEKAGEHTSDPNAFPNIVHASIAVPDFISNSQGVQTAVDNIRAACTQLPLLSSAAIGMACNTAHMLVDRLPELQNDTFVSMIEATCDDIAANGHRTVGLLSSPMTIKTKLYTKALERRGIKTLIPAEHDDELARIIRSVIDGVEPMTLRPRLTKLAQKHLDNGADMILLGCTELPLIGIDVNAPQVSSLNSLADAMILRHFNT